MNIKPNWSIKNDTKIHLAEAWLICIHFAPIFFLRPAFSIKAKSSQNKIKYNKVNLKQKNNNKFDLTLTLILLTPTSADLQSDPFGTV